MISKHADTLNELDAMQGNFHYAVRRKTIQDAERIIVEQEAEIEQLKALLDEANAAVADEQRENKSLREQIDEWNSVRDSWDRS